MLIIFGCSGRGYAQFFQLTEGRNQVSVPFKVVRNMVIIRLKINNNGPYNFILDTGVGFMVITEPSLVDSLNILDRRTLKLAGLGEGDDFDAFYTSPLNIEIPGINSVGVSAAIFKKDHFGLSNYAGMPIHGLLGYEFFNRLVVKINFNDSTLTAYRPGKMKTPRKYEALPITIESNKPFLKTCVRFCDNSERKCKLIVDIGAGHPLSLDDNNANPWPTQKTIAANLGMGLTGPISGEISRVRQLDIGKYSFTNVLSSFPAKRGDDTFIAERDGNLGLDVLKRFILIFDYSNGLLYVKPRTNLKEAFERDMSGLEYYAGGDELKRIVISRVEPGSASDDLGLAKDDEILSVNFKPVANMSLEELDHIFRSGDGRGLLLEIYHDKQFTRVILTLKRRI
ncbi:aspartyl protease family protein [Mucilaginibacter sp.]|uniref:aspartyl protease family protein n=1 Tax=Mucilaginibacter sp. TaxID=1882438 RepID=UPI00326389D6